jgi:hypothetical protein
MIREYTYPYFGPTFQNCSRFEKYVVAKLAPRRNIVIASRPNPVIALMVIDPHMVVI